jgi:excisionase family DNA binding protein
MNRNTRHLVDDQYLTVERAARQLSVHPSTIRRWIDQGHLPAYRLGPKRIGVRQSDLATMAVPRPTRGEKDSGMAASDHRPVPLMGQEEQRRGLKALHEMRRLRDELAERRGKLTRESWELLDEAREERTRDLTRVAEE